MKLISGQLKNFASYKELNFDFNGQGLTLISGDNGVGKSTLCDMAAWTLFGITAKGGKADEVLSWNGGEAECTVTVEIPSSGHWHNSGIVEVTRKRGPKLNDLYYTHKDVTEGLVRGKDAQDTQKKINSLLGTTADTYLLGSYFHEFSQTAQFFTTNAKNRREITEQLSDLALAKKLAERIATKKKEVRLLKDSAQQTYHIKLKEQETTDRFHVAESKRCAEWDKVHDQQIKEALAQSSNFKKEQQKNLELVYENYYKNESALADQISALTDTVLTPEHFNKEREILGKRLESCKDSKCKECGASKDSNKRLLIERDEHKLEKQMIENERLKSNIKHLEERLFALKTRLSRELDDEGSRQNLHKKRAQDLKAETNPHKSSADAMSSATETIKREVEKLGVQLTELGIQYSDLELLTETVDTFRGACISRTVSALEDSTNGLLSKYFDAELRVAFDVTSADKLEISIMKDGNEASYTQLSKGQRQLLKLCFGISVMHCVSNHNGVSFNCAWFDESLDGLSDGFKAKTFKLLQSLQESYSSVFVVEHSAEMKQMFDSVVEVTINDGVSTIEKH